jgi:protocatechuate 3,4-dioxygenase beta subunit
LIVAQRAGLSDVVVVLTNKTYFYGQVKDSSGNPVSGAKVRGDQGQKRNNGGGIPWIWTETTSDAQGHYRLYVQPDTYDIQVRVPNLGVARPGKIQITDGQTKHLDLTLAAGITFRLKVVDSITNEPVGGIRLWSGQNPGVEGSSDASGNLLIPFMVPGSISLNFDGDGYARRWCDAAAIDWERHPDVRNGNFQWNLNDLEFNMTAGMPAGTLVVERTVKVRGKVVDPDGNPVVGATIGAVDTGTDRSITHDERYAVRSKGGGLFELIIPPSNDHDYNLIAHDGDHRQWRKWANGVLPPFRTTSGQEVNDIAISLTRPATVRGHVVDADGNPAANRAIRAVGIDLLEDIHYEPTTRTDKNGDFVLKYVRPGSQMILVAPFVYNDLLRSPPGTITTVNLAPGQTLDGVKLTAMPGDDE